MNEIVGVKHPFLLIVAFWHPISSSFNKLIHSSSLKTNNYQIFIGGCINIHKQAINKDVKHLNCVYFIYRI